MNLEEIQEQLAKRSIDGWLFFDHHERDPLAYRILGFHPAQHVTRRWYYLIPAHGTARALVHRVEPGMLDSLPGEKAVYSGWREQDLRLRHLLAGCARVAMQYSPNCTIPYVSMVDGGTVDLIRGLGIEVVTSAELVQRFEARLDQSGLDSHLEAGKLVDRVRAEAFRYVSETLLNNGQIHEFAVAELIRRRFKECGLLSDSGPIVAVNRNAGDPHYEPLPERSSPIQRGDFLLIDMWANIDQPRSVYYDITWTGFCGQDPPEQIRNVFEIVRDARDLAIQRVQKAVVAGQEIRGFEVDDAAREHIAARGFADRFVHRTGHSIAGDLHGSGANMDNLETHDERLIIPWSCFSVEPGIYLEDFGVRSEVNVFVDDRSARVTGEAQRELVLM